MDIKHSIPLIGSEIALSLYPQLIKLVPTTIEIQVAVRCITYSILAIIGYYITHRNVDSDKKTKVHLMNYVSMGLSMGIVNIIHIISSYMCFNILSSGVSYSIFYTYPIFNLLGRTLFYNEKIDIINYIYIIISIFGVYFIYTKDEDEDKGEGENKDTTTQSTKQDTFINIVDDIFNSKNKSIGIISGIVSAITESLLYFMVKGDTYNISPYIQLFKTYLLGGILSFIYLMQNVQYKDLDYHYWITLILFNTIIGFVGYLVRFMMIPQLSTLLFNSLIFIGVIFAYIWGYLLNNESININNIFGTVLILWSIIQINKK